MKRIFLSVIAVVFLLIPHLLFAQSEVGGTGNVGKRNEENVKLRIEKKLPGYQYHNVFLKKGSAFFFAFHPEKEEIPFGWYRMGIKTGRAKRLASSSEFNLIFRVAFSADGKEMLALSDTGEIIVTNLRNNKKKSLGVYTSKFPSGEFATYNYPVYTPDGKYIILNNPWENSLRIVDAKTKDIAAGKEISGFWLIEGGGDAPESGSDISAYEFLDNGKKVKFGEHVLDIETLSKE